MTEPVAPPNKHLAELSAEIVAGYVRHNALAAGELPKLIADVHAALRGLSMPAPEAAEIIQALKPAVPIRKSLTPDYLICLEDGKKFKSLKRHLATTYSMSPAEYRQKWGLPSDYPMVAPNYSAVRSAMALSIGLGRKAAVVAPAKKLRKAATKVA